MKDLKRNLITWLIYSIGIYVLLIPFQIWVRGISISILIGFLFGMLNTITIILKRLDKE